MLRATSIESARQPRQLGQVAPAELDLHVGLAREPACVLDHRFRAVDRGNGRTLERDATALWPAPQPRSRTRFACTLSDEAQLPVVGQVLAVRDAVDRGVELGHELVGRAVPCLDVARHALHPSRIDSRSTPELVTSPCSSRGPGA